MNRSKTSFTLSFFSTLTVIVLVVIVLVTSDCHDNSTGNGKADIILTVWQTETDKGANQRLAETIARFEQENPGVKVKLESVAWSSLSSKLAVALQAGNEPDLAHLEPFMVAQIFSRDMLLPIDDVIKQIQEDNGDRIFQSVLDLQKFNGSRYGIAYAVGTTAFAYRKDTADALGLKPPRTWDEYVQFARAISQKDPKQKVLLPGGDPFFIDQLFAELVANNGGQLFDPSTNRPLLDSKQVVETLEFFSRLAPYVDTGWQTQPYLDQFNRLARGEAGNVPVTYARAAKAIESALNDPTKATPAIFAIMPQPTGPSYSGPSIATIDCEPYVIFKSAAEKKNTRYGSNAELAKKFLRLFYSRDQYLPFVKEVPIHLTPIFEGMANSPDYRSTPFVVRWMPWEEQTEEFLRDPSRVRPILMPDASDEGRALPFLLDFQSSKILTQAVADVVKNGVPPTEAARTAQRKAEQFVESLNLKRW
jgi:multiple sugar transport system substrate-binding protein